ncbi:MAG: OmpH family outer membrane protein [Paludibacteraceae bacterium]|nr:OmpH family outer membrane protein [Paludibacteraceae bacterium]
MKKIFVLMALVLPMLVNAQKFGYVNTSELLQLMPEVKVAEARIDSLNKQYENMIVGMQEELKKKVADYEQKRAGMTEAMQQIQEDELLNLQQRIQNTYQQLQQDAQMKQQEMFVPIQEKMLKAIQAVGDREGFTYIFNSSQSVLVYTAPSATNVMESVKKELGIK